MKAALANPLFTRADRGGAGHPVQRCGADRDLSIGQVHEIAGMIEGASKTQAQVVFGVIQDPRWNKRVRVTLVATGIPSRRGQRENGGERSGRGA